MRELVESFYMSELFITIKSTVFELLILMADQDCAGCFFVNKEKKLKLRCCFCQGENKVSGVGMII